LGFSPLRFARSLAGNRQPYKRCLKPLSFLDVIFLVFLEGKVGQPGQNLLQVTIEFMEYSGLGLLVDDSTGCLSGECQFGVDYNKTQVL